MAIGTDSVVEFFGTQDEVTTGTPGTVASGAFSAAGDTADWTNDDDAPLGSAVLKCQFDTTAPTYGTVNLYCSLQNVLGTDDEGNVDDNFRPVPLGAFAIDESIAADTDYVMTIATFTMRNTKSSQVYRFYIENTTGETIGTNWELHITPKTHGPHA